MYDLIVSPALGEHLVVRPGLPNTGRIPPDRYRELVTLDAARPCPGWLVTAAYNQWGLDLRGRAVGDALVIRRRGLGFPRATWEITHGCDYRCGHYDLGEMPVLPLGWDARRRLLQAIRDAGVLWLRLSGGEPTLDPLFPATYRLAYQLGMALTVATNGTRLDRPALLALLTTMPPHRIAVPMYGATKGSYERVTGRPGSFERFLTGVVAARDAGLNVRLNLAPTRYDPADLAGMRALAERLGLPYRLYPPGPPDPDRTGVPARIRWEECSRPRGAYGGCGAGRTSFHVDPSGLAGLCGTVRQPRLRLAAAGPAVLGQLAGIADDALRPAGACHGCPVTSCGTCPPVAALYRRSGAAPSRQCPGSAPGPGRPVAAGRRRVRSALVAASTWLSRLGHRDGRPGGGPAGRAAMA